jgi:hypothetical protein
VTRSGRLPLFVREAMRDEGENAELELRPVQASGALWESSVSDAEQSLLSLEDALSDVIEIEAAQVRLPESMLAQAPGRLERFVLDPPQRYAPFFRRIAELFDLSEDEVIAELTRLRNPCKWRWTGLRGVSKLAVRLGPAVRLGDAAFFRIDAGAHFPRHRHLGAERVLVLEGSYEDSNGLVHRAGELREWAAGTEHYFNVEGSAPCLLACVAFGRRFDAWPQRALAAICNR